MKIVLNIFYSNLHCIQSHDTVSFILKVLVEDEVNDFRIKEEVQLLTDSRFLPHLFKILSKQRGVKQGTTTRCVVESVLNLLIALSSH